MSELFNPGLKFTQTKIADLLGLKSDRQVRNLMNKGVLPAAKGKNGMDPLQCVHGYITYKSQTNEPEADSNSDDSEAELSYDRERSLNIREQRRARKIQNELALKTLIPTDFCVQIFASVVSAARSKVLAIEGKAATELPELSIKDRNVLRDLLHEALTDLSNEPIPPSLVAYLEESEFDLDSAAEPDDITMGG